jgi:hypothetical protein
MIDITVSNLDVTINNLSSFTQTKRVYIQKALNDCANRVASDAKSLVSSNSSNTGNLAGSIDVEYGDGSSKVVVRSDYAAYIEFGTRKFAAQTVASLPNDWKTYANTFKGPTGKSFDNLVKNITQWVKDKGIKFGRYYVRSKRRVGNKESKQKEDERAIRLIVLSILKKGIKARPFLYPSVIRNLPLLITDLKKAISS